jgi:type III secretion protein L
MVVWLRNGPCTVGVNDGLIRAADFAALTSLLELTRTMQDSALRLTAQAQCQADTLLAEAQTQAQALLQDARAQFDQGLEQGYAKGHDAGLLAWTQQVLGDAAQSQRALDRQRERLGQIVALAVERVVEQADRQAVFQRALRSVSKLVQEVPSLTLRVHEADQETARRAVDAVLAGVADGTTIEVVPDARVASGSCLFESDRGVIDAGLPKQLAAIKRAAIKAAQQCPMEDTLAPGSAGAALLCLETPATE